MAEEKKFVDCRWEIKEDHIGIFTLDRPAARNAWSEGITNGLSAALTEMEENDDLWVMIITGNPEAKAFQAGLDVKRLDTRIKSGEERGVVDQYKAGMRYKFTNHMHRIRNLNKPVITAVNEVAVGMGADFAIVGDIIIAGESARFGWYYTRLAMLPAEGGAWLLPRLIGVHKASELIFTSKMIDAKEADRIGLVNRVVPDDQLMDHCMEVARTICSRPPLAVRWAKEAIIKGLEQGYSQHFNYILWINSLLAKSEDRKEYMRAFTEKREPKYTGR